MITGPVALLRLPHFRRLLATRLLSQGADGVFQAALASYVVFSPEHQPTPGAIAAAFAAMLLPFSLVGPFAGVLLDRWRRRQVLLHGNLLRLVLCLGTAALVLAHVPTPAFFGAALLVTGVNRFVLAGLSAALPRVVGPGQLVTANAMTPTLGTLAASLGGAGGVLVRLVLPAGPDANAGLLVLAAAGYGCASLAAATMARDLLGPDRSEGSGREPLPAVLTATARGLADGVRHLVGPVRAISVEEGAGPGAYDRKAEEGGDAKGVPPALAEPRAWGSRGPTTTEGVPPGPFWGWGRACVPGPATPRRSPGQGPYDRRPAAYALGAVTASRFCYGLLLVTVLMLCRNTFAAPSDENAGLAWLGLAVALSAAGFLCAAVVSPWGTRRFGVAGWLLRCLAAAALLTPALGLFFAPAPVLAAAFLLGVVSQGVKICTDTLVQTSVEDGYRGRVFAVYDVLFNAALVAAAAVAALLLPTSGRSAAVVLGAGALYALTALGYWATVRDRTSGKPASGEPPSGDASALPSAVPPGR